MFFNERAHWEQTKDTQKINGELCTYELENIYQEKREQRQIDEQANEWIFFFFLKKKSLRDGRDGLL